MPAEQAVKVGPCETLWAVPERAENLVSNRITKRIAEHVPRRRLAVIPEGQRGQQMFRPDRLRLVEESVQGS